MNLSNGDIASDLNGFWLNMRLQEMMGQGLLRFGHGV